MRVLLHVLGATIIFLGLASFNTAHGQDPKPATGKECEAALETIKNKDVPDGKIFGRYQKAVLFNHAGTLCYVSPLFGYGDQLNIGLVFPKDLAAFDASVQVTNCPLESPTPTVLGSVSQADVQGARILGQQTNAPFVIVWFPIAPSCASEAPVITVTLPMKPTTTATLTQYPRHRGWIHLGYLYSNLHEPQFALRAQGSDKIIVNNEVEGRGLEPVGAVVIYGIGYYLVEAFSTSSSNPARWPYKGRDLIHESGFVDKIGLVIAAGLNDPAKRFGIGVSYDIAYGVSVSVVKEFIRTTELDGGAKLGSVFVGTDADIPTRKTWRKAWTVGVTFDTTYVTQLFKGK